MRGNQKSTPPNAIQVKNWQKIIDIEEKLDVISQLEKDEQILTYDIKLDALILAYVEYVIMLIELKKVLRV
jgi:chromatin segregation and condensation protein Rec8/ScpA/Scc1 (kleisin family)